jgi:hypothetical protein
MLMMNAKSIPHFFPSVGEEHVEDHGELKNLQGIDAILISRYYLGTLK